MTIIEKYQFTNLSGGIYLNLPDELKDPKPPKMILADGSKNVYYDPHYGLITMGGNTSILTYTSAITGIHKYKKYGCAFTYFTADDGSFNSFDLNAGTYTQLATSLNSAKTTSANVNDSLIVCCEGSYPIAWDGLTVTQLTNAPMGGIISEYRNRAFIALGSTLYYSKLGDITSWDYDPNDVNSGGYIEDFYTSDDISGLQKQGDYLSIHKSDGVYLLSGTKTDDYDIERSSDKGSLSAYGIESAYKKHWFFNDGINIIAPSVQFFGQASIDNKTGEPIDPEFKLLDKNKLNEIITIVYQDKNQIWFKLPYCNELDSTFWIYDWVLKEWYKRIEPQIITCGLSYDDEIILTGTSDGKILREDYGKDFDGVNMDSEAWFANQFFHDISAFKTIERLDINFERYYMTKCRRVIRIDGDINPDNEDEESIEDDESTGVYDESEWDASLFAYKRAYYYDEMLSDSFISMQLGLRASSDLNEFIAVRAIKYFNIEYEDF